MHLGYFTLLLLCLNAFATAHGDIRAQRHDNDPVANSIDRAHRYLKGTKDTGTSEDEDRMLNFAKIKSLFSKTPNLSKLKLNLGKNADLTKMKPFTGDKVDLSKVKTASGKTLDLSTIKSRSMTEGEIRKVKSFADKDPDLRSLSSLVGKNPTQLSGEQVRAAQAFIVKHPKEGVDILQMVTDTALVVGVLFVGGVLISTAVVFAVTRDY